MVMGEFEICDAGPLMPGALAALAVESASFGIRNVSSLVEQWGDGSQRFGRPGEGLLVAVASPREPGADESGAEAIGVGGLTWCPHVPEALRVRRFYVAEAWRRRGVARALATSLLGAGAEHADVITCNARASAAAPPFWESLGFTPVDIDGITHRLDKS